MELNLKCVISINAHGQWHRFKFFATVTFQLQYTMLAVYTTRSQMSEAVTQ